ncbi:uncharacterized protein LOC123526255 [Mercenaria mercenaria]|uniref:uncharacterized protein LOC123526255 n=1 Tax=Mercenaria mercenaria TaxID=6596 RepID=UPI00234F69E9|nr:uncharacterized protein LOC123526255 [Mercenaria mercenaria]
MSKSTLMCFLILLNIHGCFMVQPRARLNTKKNMVRLKSVQTLKGNDFTTFRKTMAKEIGVEDALLVSKAARDVFIKNGKYIDLKNNQQRGRIASMLLSALCSACERNCSCLRRLECSPAC